MAAFFREEGTALAYLDRRTLADIGIGPDVAWSVAVDLGIDRLRRSPLV
ncbi:MAG: hypothetical protein HY246_00950 [Proteobacteria bacterium]|nr:hypothetical protein [Pseudomonadota bacterium]